MTKLDKPIRATRTGTGLIDIITIGSDPLPSGDRNVKVALYNADIYVSGAATVRITAGDILCEKIFTAATNVSVDYSAAPREGHPTQPMRLEVSGAGAGVIATVVVGAGWEYTGGEQA